MTVGVRRVDAAFSWGVGLVWGWVCSLRDETEVNEFGEEDERQGPFRFLSVWKTSLGSLKKEGATGTVTRASSVEQRNIAGHEQLHP